MNSPARSGFTLIEMIFAIFIFAVGALGVAATTAITLRELAEAGTRERATRIAANRLEAVRTLACGTSANGSDVAQGVHALWTVAPSGALTSAATTVSYSLGGGLRAESYSLLFHCGP